jgi:hypothetical protein
LNKDNDDLEYCFYGLLEAMKILQKINTKKLYSAWVHRKNPITDEVLQESSEDRYELEFWGNRLSYLKKITGMAVSRDTWVANVASRLHGMLGEYAFERYGRLINYDHSWDAEIERLLRPLRKMLDPKITKTKATFDRKKAFREACRDAIGSPVTSTAKNFFLNAAKKVSDDEFKRVAGARPGLGRGISLVRDAKRICIRPTSLKNIDRLIQCV